MIPSYYAKITLGESYESDMGGPCSFVIKVPTELSAVKFVEEHVSFNITWTDFDNSGFAKNGPLVVT